MVPKRKLSRRSFFRSVAGFAAGGSILVGTGGRAAAAQPSDRDPIDPAGRGRANRVSMSDSDGGSSGDPVGQGRGATRAVSPIVGLWRETRHHCAEAGERSGLIGELIFAENGRFAVTFSPSERYRDYWGWYQHDPRSGALELVIDGGNFIPRDVDPMGVARIGADLRLVLDGLSLGTRQGSPQRPAGCVLTFERR